MIRRIAVIDTNVILDILDTTGTPASVDRRERIELTLQELQKERARFVVPSPVVAELCRGIRGSEAIRKLAGAVLRGVRIETLDMAAAEVAARIADSTVPGKTRLERGAVKYDALIAGIAEYIGAYWLVTSNVGHLRTCLEAIDSKVKIVDPTEQFSPQGVMVPFMRPPPKAPPSTVEDAVEDPVE